MAKRDAEFQQRVIAATLPHDPELKLAAAIFEPKGPSEGSGSIKTNNDGEAIFYPSTAEEFEEMIQMFEEMD